jgi:hypothetical protein
MADDCGASGRRGIRSPAGLRARNGRPAHDRHSRAHLRAPADCTLCDSEATSAATPIDGWGLALFAANEDFGVSKRDDRVGGGGVGARDSGSAPTLRGDLHHPTYRDHGYVLPSAVADLLGQETERIRVRAEGRFRTGGIQPSSRVRTRSDGGVDSDGQVQSGCAAAGICGVDGDRVGGKAGTLTPSPFSGLPAAGIPAMVAVVSGGVRRIAGRGHVVGAGHAGREGGGAGTGDSRSLASTGRTPPTPKKSRLGLAASPLRPQGCWPTYR